MALGDIIARLSVELGLNSAAFEKNAKRAGTQTKDLGDKMESMGHRTGTAIRGIAAAGAAIAGSYIVSQIKDMAMAGLEHASSLGEQAQQLGVTSSELQRYRFIASQVGISQETMDKGLARLSVTLGDLANGAKLPTEALARLGFSTERIAEIAKMSAGQAIPVLSEAFKGLKSPTEQASIAADLFGAKMGGKFLTLLNLGASGIDELTAAYKKLGIEVSGDQIAKADEAIDKMAAMNTAILAKQAQLAVSNIDTIMKGTMAWEHFKLKMLEVAGSMGTAFGTADTTMVAFSESIKKIDAQLGIMSPVEFTDSIKKNFSDSFKRIADFFIGLYKFTTEAPGYVLRMVNEIGKLISVTLAAYWAGAKAQIEAVKGWFRGLYEAVVGHSYIPDMVDGIAQQMARLDAVMVNPAKTAAERTKQQFEKLASDVDDIMRRLYPDAAATAGFAGDRAKLNAGIAAGGASGYTPPQLQDALKSLQSEQFKDAFKDFQVSVNDNAAIAETANVRIVDSFKDMADKTIGALQSLSRSIEGGGFLDILGSVIGLGLQLGSVGLFGKSIQTNINKAGGFAGGTPNAPPGLAWVGERGPELVNFKGGERVYSNSESRAMGRGGGDTRISVEASPFFDVRVNGQIMKTAPAIANAGSDLAMRKSAYSQSRRLAA